MHWATVVLHRLADIDSAQLGCIQRVFSLDPFKPN